MYEFRELNCAHPIAPEVLPPPSFWQPATRIPDALEVVLERNITAEAERSRQRKALWHRRSLLDEGEVEE